MRLLAAAALAPDQDVEDSDDNGAQQRCENAHILQREVEWELDVRLEERCADNRDHRRSKELADLLAGQILSDEVGGDGNNEDDQQPNERELVSTGRLAEDADDQEGLVEDGVQDAATKERDVVVSDGRQYHGFPYSSARMYSLAVGPSLAHNQHRGWPCPDDAPYAGVESRATAA